MIPDKIYIPRYPNLDTDGFHLGDDWMEKPDIYSKCEHVEYIRKEALLEWKKELEEHVRKCAGGIVGQYEHGYWKALDDLIDKLNEM